MLSVRGAIACGKRELLERETLVRPFYCGLPRDDVHGDRLDLAAEGKRLLAGVHDVAGDELVAEVGGEVAESGEVFGVDGCACLHLNTDDAAVGCLDDASTSVNASFGVPVALLVCPEDQAGMVLMRKTLDSSSR